MPHRLCLPKRRQNQATLCLASLELYMVFTADPTPGTSGVPLRAPHLSSVTPVTKTPHKLCPLKGSKIRQACGADFTTTAQEVLSTSYHGSVPPAPTRDATQALPPPPRPHREEGSGHPMHSALRPLCATWG